MRPFALQSLACALGIACAIALCGGCNSSNKPAPVHTVAETAGSRTPSELQALADSLLGSGSRVVAYGDLAQNGREQALVIDPITTSANDPSDLIFTRAALLEREGAKWREILRCDEHLKNTRGFLGGAPLVPITGWKLELMRDRNGKDAVQTLYFTPLPARESARVAPIAVRWNRKLNRYQSVDQKNEQFLAELTLLETPSSELR
jgi:hypothetical protein